MTGLASLAVREGYRSDESDLYSAFLEPVLRMARRYDRAVGYFRTSVLSLAALPLVDLALTGGTIRVVCSPSLTDEDIRVWRQGSILAESVANRRVRSSIHDLLEEGPDQELAVRVLATLLAFGSLDVRLAFRPDSTGIYHEKLGVLTDEEENAISFVGSANETVAAWSEHGNFEAIEVFRSWRGDSEAGRVSRHAKYFEQLWNGHVRSLAIVRLDDTTREMIASQSFESLARCREAVGRTTSTDTPPARRPIDRVVPRTHQAEVVADWHHNGCRGIIEHATGSGKTISALLCMREHLDQGGVVLLVVPSKLLVKQWLAEVQANYPDVVTHVVGRGRTRSAELERLSTMLKRGNSDSPGRVIISTVQTASRAWFVESMRNANHSLVVADEVHRTGSPKFRQMFNIDAEKRLGLSATPERYGDEEGTGALFGYFGRVLDPVFGISDAIASGSLVPYRYYIKLADLSEAERSEYEQLSRRISQLFARTLHRKGSNVKDAEKRLKGLLIQRSRLVKKAERKAQVAHEIVRTHFREGDRWLVYCEDVDQLQDVKSLCLESRLPVFEYHFELANQQETLNAWSFGGGVMVAIRCLDEGVNIPAISHAVIAASSRNPREFVQRRGRVLRPHPGKSVATVYDIVVLPDKTSLESSDGLSEAEAARALLFARDALNVAAEVDLRAALASRNPDVLAKLASVGDEADD